MADTKISALTASTIPLAGTEVLPIVQSGVTKQVSVANLTVGRAVDTQSVSVTAGYPVYLNGASGNTQILYYASLVIDMQVNGTKGFRLYAPGAGTSELRGDWAVNSTGGGSGNLTMSNGNIIQGTAAKGINFTANTAAAGMTSQLLNDYQEGTWTPSIDRSATSPTITYTTQSGYYRKVGSMVYLSGILIWTANSGGSGNWLISGFPFSVPAGVYDPLVVASWGGITNSAGYTIISLQTRGSNAQAYVNESGGGVTTQWLGSGTGAIGASGSMYFAGWFRA